MSRALACQHGVAHAFARGQRVVERLDEPARGLDQHAVAHGDHGGHADLQQLGRDRLGRLLGLRGLAGVEEDERDAVIAQQRLQPRAMLCAVFGVNDDVPAFLRLADVLGQLEAQPAEADGGVIDAVAVEVDDMIRLAGAPGAVEFLAQRRQRGRAEDVELDQAGQRFHRLDQRQRAGPMIEIVACVIFRSWGDEQDADGRGDDGDAEALCAGQPAADAGWLRPLKQK